MLQSRSRVQLRSPAYCIPIATSMSVGGSLLLAVSLSMAYFDTSVAFDNVRSPSSSSSKRLGWSPSSTSIDSAFALSPQHASMYGADFPVLACEELQAPLRPHSRCSLGDPNRTNDDFDLVWDAYHSNSPNASNNTIASLDASGARFVVVVLGIRGAAIGLALGGLALFAVYSVLTLLSLLISSVIELFLWTCPSMSACAPKDWLLEAYHVGATTPL